MLDYDAVVIGAGNAGLTAAARLAKEGHSVLLAERHNVPGGCASSFVRGRFEFETALHELCDLGTPESPGWLGELFADLGLEVDWRPVPDAFRAISLGQGDLAYDVRMPFGRESFIDAMEEACPGSRSSIRKVFELADDTVRALGYSMSMQGRPDDAVMRAEHGRFLRFAPYSVNRVLRALGVPPRAASILNSYWGYLGVDCDRLSFLHYAVMLYMYIDKHAYIPACRSHEVSCALTDLIRAHGGEVIFGASVERIHVERGEVVGVRVDGQDVSCRVVLSNAMPHTVYGDLMDESDVPAIERKRANARSLAVSGLVVYLGLDASHEDLGIGDYSVFISHTGDSTQDFRRMASIAANDLSIFNCLNVAVPTCSPAGTSVVYGTTLYQPDAWNGVGAEEYLFEKERVARRMIDDYERVCGIRLLDHIEEVEVAAPPTFARFVNTPQGSIYGYLTAGWDGMIERLRTMYEESPIEGLRFVGGHAEWSSGYVSAYMVGDIAARISLERIAGARRFVRSA